MVGWQNIEEVKFNDIQDGKVLDPVTWEELNPERAVKLGERFYDRATALSIILSDNPRDPYNNQNSFEHLIDGREYEKVETKHEKTITEKKNIIILAIIIALLLITFFILINISGSNLSKYLETILSCVILISFVVVLITFVPITLGGCFFLAFIIFCVGLSILDIYKRSLLLYGKVELSENKKSIT